MCKDYGRQERVLECEVSKQNTYEDDKFYLRMRQIVMLRLMPEPWSQARGSPSRHMLSSRVSTAYSSGFNIFRPWAEAQASALVAYNSASPLSGTVPLPGINSPVERELSYITCSVCYMPKCHWCELYLIGAVLKIFLVKRVAASWISRSMSTLK